MKVAFTALLLVFQAGLISVRAHQLALASTESGNSAAYSHLAAQAKEFGEACVNIDVERALQLTWPKYVERYGRDSLAADLPVYPRALEAHGVQLASWVPSAVTKLVEHDGSLYTVVRTKLKFKRGEQTSEAPLCLIAISADSGEHWTFISATCINVKAEFPAIADKLNCPDSDNVIYIK